MSIYENDTWKRFSCDTHARSHIHTKDDYPGKTWIANAVERKESRESNVPGMFRFVLK